MHTTHCPRCNSPAHYIPEMEGRVVVCPKCQTSFALVKDPGLVPEGAVAAALPVAQVVGQGSHKSPAKVPDRSGPPPLPARRRAKPQSVSGTPDDDPDEKMSV